jgi:putative oxidoreductase
MKKLLNAQPLNSDLALLVLRVAVGGLMVFHGYGKLMNFSETLAYFPDPIGLGNNVALGLVVFAEFFCGILVILGLFTRLAIVPIFITMLVAYFVAHAADPFIQKELPFVFGILSIIIFISGSGRYALDYPLFGSANKRRPIAQTL